LKRRLGRITSLFQCNPADGRITHVMNQTKRRNSGESKLDELSRRSEEDLSNAKRVAKEVEDKVTDSEKEVEREYSGLMDLLEGGNEVLGEKPGQTEQELRDMEDIIFLLEEMSKLSESSLRSE